MKHFVLLLVLALFCAMAQTSFERTEAHFVVEKFFNFQTYEPFNSEIQL